MELLDQRERKLQAGAGALRGDDVAVHHEGRVHPAGGGGDLGVGVGVGVRVEAEET